MGKGNSGTNSETASINTAEASFFYYTDCVCCCAAYTCTCTQHVGMGWVNTSSTVFCTYTCTSVHCNNLTLMYIRVCGFFFNNKIKVHYNLYSSTVIREISVSRTFVQLLFVHFIYINVA